MENTERPNIDAFLDYREYLRAQVKFLKATRRGFSYRQFSRVAGFQSPNFLKLVELGQRNLSLESIGKFSKALGLKNGEQEKFSALVQFNQAASDEDRNRLFHKIRRWHSRNDDAKLRMDQFDVYSHWYVIPVRELAAQSDFVPNADWIARRLHPAIRPREAEHALELLKKVGLLEETARGVKPKNVKLSTGTPGPLAARNYHRALLQHAAGSLDGVPVNERNITSLTLNLSATQYQALCERIEQFRQELLDNIEDHPAAPGEKREVYVVGFQVFPVTRSNGGLP